MTTIKIRDLDLSQISYSDVIQNRFGGKTVYINLPERKRVSIQTPKMFAPFGLSVSQVKDKLTQKPLGPPRYYLELSFGKAENRKAIVELFHQLVDKWDNQIRARAMKNCVKWFKIPKSQVNDGIIDQKYKSMLIKFKNDEGEETGLYADRMKFKIPFDEKKNAVKDDIEIYDENTNRVGIDYLSKGCEVVAIVQCNGIWFVGNNFGVSWNVMQMQIFKPSRVSGFSILDDLEEEDEDEYNPEESTNDRPDVEVTESAPIPAKVEAKVEDTDEETTEEEEVAATPTPEETTEEEEEPEPEPEPEPVKPKKRGRKPKGEKTQKGTLDSMLN